MDIINKTYNETFCFSKLLKSYFKDIKCAFLDIETTGINANQNKVILIGVMVICHNQLTIHQVFADHKEEEEQLLRHSIDLLESIDIFLNYNASAFDIPFLNKRFSLNKIAYQIPKYKSFDLYKMIKKYGYNLLPNYQLKTVEQFLGIQRTDTLSGKDCIENYNLYEKNKDVRLKEKILLHNREDIYYLSKILPLLNKYNIHQIMFENSRYINNDIIIIQSSIKKYKLIINGILKNLSQDYTVYEHAYSFNYEHEAQAFTLSIPLYKKENLYYLSLSDLNICYQKKIPSPDVSDDYIIVKKNNEINYLEVNSFIDTFILDFLPVNKNLETI